MICQLSSFKKKNLYVLSEIVYDKKIAGYGGSVLRNSFPHFMLIHKITIYLRVPFYELLLLHFRIYPFSNKNKVL